MIHPDTELRIISPTIGYGLFAKKFIPKGTITYIKDGLELEITPEKYLTLEAGLKENVDKYSYRDEKGNRIVSWDFGKYVNHCCNCNTMSTGYGFEIAIRDIEANEEITDEYGIFNLDESMFLECSKPNCRGVISGKDFDMYYKDWDVKIVDALQHFKKHEQPLLFYMENGQKEELEMYFEQPEKYKSVYALKLHEVELNNKH